MPRKKGKARKEKSEVLVLCAGETEEKYFRLLSKYFRDEGKTVLDKIKVEIDSDSLSQLELVHKANHEKNKGGYNEVWVVFDEDDGNDLDGAVEWAKKKDINVAYSNIAFEYWLLLHLRDKHKYESVKEMETELTRLLGFEYKKAENLDRVFKKLNAKILEAEDCCDRRYQSYEVEGVLKPSEQKPCSTVHKLVKRLRKWHGC